MSDLQHAEKMLLEKILKMEGGYCLGFSNPTFARFFQDVLDINIYDDRFISFGTSKANRMRCFWAQATNKGVAKLLNYLFSNWEVYHCDETDEVLPTKAFEIVYRLDPSLRKPISSPTIVYDAVSLNELYAKFQELTVMVNSQARGFAFERFLNEFFECFGLEPRSSFRTVGEQIDGSFISDGNTYLVEAKWHESTIGSRDLYSFHSQVEAKTTWARGLFISLGGFSKDGLEAFSRGRSTNMIGMDGQDLFFILKGEISLPEVIRLKARKAAEEGTFFKPVFEIIRHI